MTSRPRRPHILSAQPRPPSTSRLRGLRPCLLLVALLLSASCREPIDPLLRERVALLDGSMLARVLERTSRLEGTPIARQGRALRERLEGCETLWGHFEAEEAVDRLLARLRCLRPADENDARLALARARRGEAGGWIQWPVGRDGRLELRLEAEDVDLALRGRLEPPSELGGLALILPGTAPPAPAAIEPSHTLIHARLRPEEGFRLSRLIPEDGQADRLFALKGRLLEGALLAGTWEVAFMPPAAGGALPLAVAAVHHRFEAPIRQAVAEILDQLEQTWPIRRTRRSFGGVQGSTVEGGCYLELPLLPELAPCWAITPSALLVGYRPEAIEQALAPPSVSAGPQTAGAPTRSGKASPVARSGIEIHLDRLRTVDRALAPDASGARPGDLWSDFDLHLERSKDGSISIQAHLEAR